MAMKLLLSILPVEFIHLYQSPTFPKPFQQKMHLPPLLEWILSSKQDCVVLPHSPSSTSPIDPQHPSTSSSTPASAASSTASIFASRTSKAYRHLKRDCLRRGQLFVDSDFPPTNESLFLDEKSCNGADLEIEWKRPGEIVDNPKLFVEGASPFDVTQGILGNCWFVSACSALTHNEALLQKVIPDPQGQEWAEGNSYAGIFQFCFWRFGRWVNVLIDDLLPCKDDKLLFARSKTPNEFWSALLEKAFAKLYGCYENLVGGQLADALQDVSGGVAESLNVRKFLNQQINGNGKGGALMPNGTPKMGGGEFAHFPPSPKLPPEIQGTRRLFYILKHAFDREALIVAAIAAKKEEVEKSLDCGLVLGHAYAITAIRYIELDAGMAREMPDRGSRPLTKRKAMVRLQNPWGEKEWNGPWSDGSGEWEQVTEMQKRRLGITVDEDGEFWMPWDEFVHYFTDISVCQLLNTDSVDPGLKRRMSIKASRISNATIGMSDKQFGEWTFFGRWTSNGVKSGAPKDRAGGCLNFPATFCFNPQFLFDIPENGKCPAEVMFALSQKDEFVGRGRMGGRKTSKQRQPYLVVGIHLMRVEANRGHRIHQAINPVATSEYSSGRSVYLHLAELPPGRYLLIPSTFAPREEAEFMLRIYSSNPKLNPIELVDDVPINGLAKCGIRAHCVIRLRIIDAEIWDGQMLEKGEWEESNLFCRLIFNGERVQTMGMPLENDHSSVIFNESLLFYGNNSSQKFRIELRERRRPFRLRSQCLGRAELRIICDQNDCIIKQIELRRMGQPDGIVGKLRIQICSYDDPLYI